MRSERGGLWPQREEEVIKPGLLHAFRNKTVISSFPDRSGYKFTEKQLQNQSRMSQANMHAKMVMADEEKRHAAQIRLNVPRNQLQECGFQFLKRIGMSYKTAVLYFINRIC